MKTLTQLMHEEMERRKAQARKELKDERKNS